MRVWHGKVPSCGCQPKNVMVPRLGRRVFIAEPRVSKTSKEAFQQAGEIEDVGGSVRDFKMLQIRSFFF